MDSMQLKSRLTDLRLSQADVARLLGVTSRAVALWVGNDRPIPGPVVAYLRVLSLLPSNLLQLELSQLKGGFMRDGMYRVRFQSPSDSGDGVLVFDSGRVWGTDIGNARYDGEYLVNDHTGKADVRLKVTFPANGMSVFGIKNPYEWSIDVTTILDPQHTRGQLTVQTSLQQALTAQYEFMRPLPDAA
jgi:hypothetical protein